MAGFLDTYRTEVHGDNVEGRVCCSLEHATEASGKTVGAERLHGVDHHATSPATAQGFHDGGGEGGDDIVAHSAESEYPRNSVQKQIHSAAGAEHCDTNKNGHQIRDNHDGGMETVLGAFDKGFVGLDLLINS